MGDTTISQDEIDALLNASNNGGAAPSDASTEPEGLTEQEKEDFIELYNRDNDKKDNNC